MLRAGIVNEEVVAVGKVSPHKAVCTADTLALMRTNLRRIELASRQAAIRQTAPTL
ncbi:MAG: hypothetical protein OXB91_08640 [Bryobacterales bacterium]|nr:hypothetical protein [Bryobacterales bacterium]